MYVPPGKRSGSIWTLIAYWLLAAFVFYVVVMLLFAFAMGAILWT